MTLLFQSDFEIPPLSYKCLRCTYEEAILYCFSLDIDGKTGWRLPTSHEHRTIMAKMMIYSEKIWYVDRDDEICVLIPVRTKNE